MIYLNYAANTPTDPAVLVAVCAVDSELGTIQPIREISALVQGYPNCHLHVDATQAVGKIWNHGQQCQCVDRAGTLQTEG